MVSQLSLIASTALAALATGYRSGFFSLAIARLASLAGALITIPVLTRYLGAGGFGVYATITSLAAWISLLQFGVGPTVLNELSGADLEREPSRVFFSSAYWLQIAVATVALILGFTVWWQLDWGHILNAPTEMASLVDNAVLIFIALLCLNIPISLYRPLFLSRGLAHLAGRWESVGIVMMVIGLVCAVKLESALPVLIGIVVGVPASAAACGFLHATRIRPALSPTLTKVAISEVQRILGSASHFTAITTGAAVISATDNLIIASQLSAAEVTPYAVTLRLYQLVFIFGGVALDVYWPHCRSAVNRGDWLWVSRVHPRLKQGLVASACLLSVVMVLFGDRLVGVWTGDVAVPSRLLLISLAAAAILQASVLADGRLLEAAGRTGAYAGILLLNAGVNLTVSLTLVHFLGAPGVAIGTAVGYAVAYPLISRTRRQLEST